MPKKVVKPAKNRKMPDKSLQEFYDFRVKVMDQTNGLVAQLHDAGFTNLYVESTQISSDAHFWQRIYIDRTEMRWEDLDRVKGIAALWGARVMLSEMNLGYGHTVSRISVWASHDA